MDIQAVYEKWEQLHDEWAFANQAARAASHKIAAMWKAHALGHGPQPTAATIKRTLQLERAADEKMLAVKRHLKAAFS